MRLLRRGDRVRLTRNVTVHIPDKVAARIATADADLERQGLEGIALEAFRAGRRTCAELRQLLELETCVDVDGFLEACGISRENTAADPMVPGHSA